MESVRAKLFVNDYLDNQEFLQLLDMHASCALYTTKL